MHTHIHTKREGIKFYKRNYILKKKQNNITKKRVILDHRFKIYINSSVTTNTGATKEILVTFEQVGE